jgi:DNA-binding CsgD family transcriptional regulator
MPASSAQLDQDGRHRFAGALQSALSLDEVEQAFIAAAGGIVPASGVGFYRLDPNSGAMLDMTARVDVDFLDDYERYGRGDDPVLQFVLRHRRPIDSSRAVPREAWQNCGARAALEIGGYGHSLEAPVLVSGILYGTINFARPDARPEFSDADLVSARVAGEQLGLATERALRYESSGQRATLLEHAMDRIPQALVVTDLDAEVIFRNRAARNAQQSYSTRSAQLIERSIEDALAEFRSMTKRVHTGTVVDPSTGQRLIVRSYRLPDRDDAALTLVFDCEPEPARGFPVWDVLSRREQEIVELVSQGLTNKEIAQRAFVTENTVKQHLKRVFTKTDVRNRAELMQRVWTAGQAAQSLPE